MSSQTIDIIGATSLAEYAVNGHSIIVVGENHMSGYESPTGSFYITAANFLVNQAKRGSRVLLEIPPGFVAEWAPLMGSKNIADTYKAAVAAGMKNALEGFDLRSAMLRSVDQDTLYLRPSELYILKGAKIAEIYVYPISRDGRISMALLPDRRNFSDQGQYEFMRTQYVGDMVSHCDYTIAALEKWDAGKDREGTVAAMRDLWKKVADYSILRDVFSTKKDIAILCGEYHARNIRAVLRKFLA